MQRFHQTRQPVADHVDHVVGTEPSTVPRLRGPRDRYPRHDFGSVAAVHLRGLFQHLARQLGGIGLHDARHFGGDPMAGICGRFDSRGHSHDLFFFTGQLQELAPPGNPRIHPHRVDQFCALGVGADHDRVVLGCSPEHDDPETVAAVVDVDQFRARQQTRQGRRCGERKLVQLVGCVFVSSREP